MSHSGTHLTLLIAAACSACSSSNSFAGAEPATGSHADTGAPTVQVGCAGQTDADAYVAGMKKTGESGRYSFELVSSMPAPPALDDNTFVLKVRGSDGLSLNGELGVALDMPQHGHPSPAAPAIRFDEHAQAFSLDPMDLFMVGLWRITFTFRPGTSADGAAGEASTTNAADVAVFRFCIE